MIDSGKVKEVSVNDILKYSLYSFQPLLAGYTYFSKIWCLRLTSKVHLLNLIPYNFSVYFSRTLITRCLVWTNYVQFGFPNPVLFRGKEELDVHSLAFVTIFIRMQDMNLWINTKPLKYLELPLLLVFLITLIFILCKKWTFHYYFLLSNRSSHYMQNN